MGGHGNSNRVTGSATDETTTTTLMMDDDSLSSNNNNHHPYTNKPSHGGHGKSTIGIRQLVVSVLVGLSLPILLPSIHMLIFTNLWGQDKLEVDKKDCTCNCWDTIFKGPYEAGVASYKHVYFNNTSNTFKMWVATVLFFVAMYEIFKHVVLLMYKDRLRKSMALLLVMSIHSHYYAWWGHWNYWNDEFYKQWSHQLFFTLTELISSIFVVAHLDLKKPMSPIPLLIIGSIAFFHVTTAMKDQFFSNVLVMKGDLHQVMRDIFLMATDAMQLIVVWKELKVLVTRRASTFRQLLLQRNHLLLIAGMNGAMMLYILFCP